MNTLRLKRPLHVVEDAQGPMGILDADGKAVVWLSDTHIPTKGFCWKPGLPKRGRYYQKRTKLVQKIFWMLTK